MNLQKLGIALVDDDPNDAELTLMSLRKEGLVNKIVIAGNGAKAPGFLFCRGEYATQRYENLPRLVLLDLNIPRVSDGEALQAIKADKHTRTIPIAVLTLSNHEGRPGECCKLGVNSHIQKRVELNMFQVAVRQFATFWLMISERPPVYVTDGKS